MHIQKIKCDKFNGTKAVTFLATLLIIHMTGIDNPHFFSFLASAAIATTHSIPSVYAIGRAGNITSIYIKAGPGASSTATPLHPSILYLHKGDTVRWVNNDNVNHSITSLLFNSGNIWPKGSSHGPSTFSYTFNQTDTIVYVDRLQPYLGGVLYVDVPTTQRELISTTTHFVNVKIEMPQNAAYKSNYGGFFIPAGTQVPLGTKVTRSNKDYVAHTATSADGYTFDTKTILPGTSVTITLQHKGVFPYYCKIHPWMMGAIVVS
jgi:plastocyanin